MRSIAEIDADIAEVQARLAKRDQGMPLRNSPEYRAARFDYIVDGDRSGLDAYQNALNAAIQNKLSRESQEKLLKEGKQQADDEQMDQWQKDYTFAKSAQAEAYANPKATPRERENADANVRYYEAVGAKKGYMKKYSDMTKAPKGEPKQETPPQKKTWGQTRAGAHTAAYSKNSTKEDVENALREVNEYSDNDYVAQEAAEARTALNNRGEEIRGEEWKTFKNDADSAIKHGDRKRAQELYDKIGDYGNHDDVTPVKDKLYAFLNPKQDNLKSLVMGQYSIEELSNISTSLMGESEGKKEKTLPLKDGRTAKLVRLKDGSLDVRNEKGKSVGTIPAKRLKLNFERNTSSDTLVRKKPAKASETPKNPVASVLTSGDTSGEILPISGDIW